MSSNPYKSPDAVGEPPPLGVGTRKRGIGTWLAVAGVIGLVIALFLPAVRTSREAPRRMSCANNLKQIAMALHEYQAEYHSLPPAYTVDAEGKPLHSWRTLILPYFEEGAPLYDKIDLSKPWDDPANKAVCETVLLTYRCPSADCPPGHTTYLAIVAEGSCFRPTEPRRLSEITDAHSLTLTVVEVEAARHVQWMSPTDVSEQWIESLGTLAQEPHPGGANAVCVEGNVLFLRSGMEASTLRALVSIAGNDDASAQEAD